MQDKSSFTPERVGIYEVELKVVNQTGEKSVIVKLTAVNYVPSVFVINQDITQDHILEDIIEDPTVPDYIVTADIGVRARLTIMPGVVIAFEDKKGMTINQSGSLVAKGSAEKKIVFTGKNTAKGYWSGIAFTSNNPLNELLHVEVNYAGGHPIYPMPHATAIGITNGLGNIIHLKEVKIQHSDGYGIYVNQQGMLGEFDQVTFSGVKNHVMALPINNVRNIQEYQITTSNNLKNIIRHSVISGGGSQPLLGFGHGRANIGVTAGTSGRLIITYSKIVKGSGWGIIVESNFGGKLNLDADIQNEFEDMTLGSVIRL